MGKNVEIDDDVLRAAEKLAAERQTTAGQIISDLARQALLKSSLSMGNLPVRDGFYYLPERGGIVTPELVESLAKDEF